MQLNFKRSLALLLLSTSMSVYAQQTYTARVVNQETGEPIIGAIVSSSNGEKALTDAQGRFSLPLNENQTIRISYLGFAPQSVNGKAFRNGMVIGLIPGIDLQEVKVTASISSARSKKALGSNVEHVDVSKLTANEHANSLNDILDGRVGGVQMYQSNGKVGMPIRFNMRSGATISMDRDPIIYVDGIKYNTTHISDINSSQDALSALNDLPIEDIASIDVIKGPSAAASYGAEAANGVIVITTKRGSFNAKENNKADIQVKMSLGAASLARKYDQFVNNNSLNNFFETGWQKNLYGTVSKSFRGNQNMFFSYNMNDVEGIVPGNRDQRHTTKLAYDIKSGPLSVSATASYVHGNISLPQTAMGRYDAIWNLMINQTPWPYVEESTWRAQSWTYNNDRFLGNIRLGYLLPGAVKLETVIGVDVNSTKGVYRLPYGYLLGNNNEGAKNVSNRRNSSFNWDIKASRKFKLADKWNLTATLLSQIARQYETVNTVNASRFKGDVDNIAAATERNVSENTFEQRTWGLYGEAFVNYDNRLFINAGLRRDASNLIGSNVASIYYPSLSVAYNLENQKFRLAYGESGRLPYPTDARTSYVMDGISAYGPTVKPQFKGNPNIRPERMREIEFGTDWTLAKRHNLSLTLYAQYTSDAIIYENLLSSDGWIGSIPRNVGRIKGHGIEFGYNGLVWKDANKHSLDVYANVNYQANKVTDTGGSDITNYPNVIKKGYPVYSFYYHTVEKTALNADGTYNAKMGAVESSDYKYLGKPFPAVNGSFGFNLKLFSNITFGTKWNYALGASVYNQSFYNTAGLGDNLKKRNDQLTALANATVGTPEYEKIANDLAYTARFRANYIEKADFLRLSNLNVGYDFTSLARKLTNNTITSMRLSFSVQNVFVITNYSGADPQVEGNGGNRKQRGIGSLSRDITNAPHPRTYTATLSFTL